MKDDEIHLWLDAADKVIKAIAVLIGGAWTWRNHRKTSPHSLKLDLSISAKVFFSSDWFLSASVSMKNIGATKLKLQSEGTACELFAIFDDLSEKQLDVDDLTVPGRPLGPGEAVQDFFQWKIPTQPREVIWYRIEARVVADGLEWDTKQLVRAERNG